MATSMVMTNEHSSPYHVIISFDEERLNDRLYLGVVTKKNGQKIAHIPTSTTRSTEILIDIWRHFQDVMNLQNLQLFRL